MAEFGSGTDDDPDYCAVVQSLLLNHILLLLPQYPVPEKSRQQQTGPTVHFSVVKET